MDKELDVFWNGLALAEKAYFLGVATGTVLYTLENIMVDIPENIIELSEKIKDFHKLMKMHGG